MAETSDTSRESSPFSQHARRVTGSGGLPKIVIDHPAAAGEIYLHGGHVTHWQPAGHESVIYLSPLAKFAPGRAIRGGIPICLPWFGPLAGRPDAPAHGFVRTAEWALCGISENDDGVTIRLRFQAPVGTSAFYDEAFTADLAVTFGRSLKIALNVTNSGDIALAYDEALHTYYRVGDVRRVTVSGLHGASYLDKPAGNAPRVESAAAITFGNEVDRVYIDTGDTCVIHDPLLGRRIAVSKFLSRSTVVWNPAERRAGELADLGAANWADFVCVETANIADDGIKLAPGGSHEMVLTVGVEAA